MDKDHTGPLIILQQPLGFKVGDHRLNQWVSIAFTQPKVKGHAKGFKFTLQGFS